MRIATRAGNFWKDSSLRSLAPIGIGILRMATDLKLAQTNGGHKAAGEGTFTAVTEEELGVAGGAEIAGKNVLGAQARGEEL